MKYGRKQAGFTLPELLLVIAILGIIAVFSISYFLGMRERAKVVAIVRANVRLMQMSLEQARSDRGSYPDGGTYTWSLIPGHVQFPGPNPLPGFRPDVPPPGFALEFKLTIPTGSADYFVQIRDPVKGNHYFQVDPNGAETTF